MSCGNLANLILAMFYCSTASTVIVTVSKNDLNGSGEGPRGTRALDKKKAGRFYCNLQLKRYQGMAQASDELPTE